MSADPSMPLDVSQPLNPSMPLGPGQVHAVALRICCVRCRHARSFHGNADEVPCKATGCHSGGEGLPCPGFQESLSAVG